MDDSWEKALQKSLELARTDRNPTASGTAFWWLVGALTGFVEEWGSEDLTGVGQCVLDALEIYETMYLEELAKT